MIPTTLVLVKHAQPNLDASRPAREWLLSTEGELQSKRLASRLCAFAPLRLVASPEPKAARTGQIVGAELGLQVSQVEGIREFDRPVLPLMSKAEHERENAAIFADLNRPVLGVESGRAALDRFAAAIAAELARTAVSSLVVITHGTVISLFVAAHNQVDAFELWRKLACPSFVVLEIPSFSLRDVQRE